MIRRDPLPDRELGAILRQFDAADEITPEQHRALKRRIEASAAAVFAQRADGAWWEFAAVWARTLIPIGLITAFAAAVVIVWASHTGTWRSLLTPVPAQDSLVGAAHGDHTSQHLLDYLVAPTVPDHH
jgi:hypothetical protein